MKMAGLAKPLGSRTIPSRRTPGGGTLCGRDNDRPLASSYNGDKTMKHRLQKNERARRWLATALLLALLALLALFAKRWSEVAQDRLVKALAPKSEPKIDKDGVEYLPDGSIKIHEGAEFQPDGSVRLYPRRTKAKHTN